MDLTAFYKMSQAATPSRAGTFAFLTCEWESIGDRIHEESDPIEEFTPAVPQAPKSLRRPTLEPLTNMSGPEDYEMASVVD